MVRNSTGGKGFVPNDEDIKMLDEVYGAQGNYAKLGHMFIKVEPQKDQGHPATMP